MLHCNLGRGWANRTIIDRLASANNFWNWVMGSWWPTVVLNVLKCFLETKQNNNWFTCTTEEVFKAQLSKQWRQISYILKTLSIVFYSLFLTKSSSRFACHVKLKLTHKIHTLTNYFKGKFRFLDMPGFPPPVLQNPLKHKYKIFPFRSKYKSERPYS